MSFTLGSQLVFIDSLQFMNSSLSSLADNLPKDQFKYLSRVFKDNKLKLMQQKGVYPYEYINYFTKFSETYLPSQKAFYSSLSESPITEEDYRRANEVWSVFGLKNMGEYHDLYLKSDVLIITDVFGNFRKECLKYNQLDPAHYLSAPGLSWDAMLKKFVWMGYESVFTYRSF